MSAESPTEAPHVVDEAPSAKAGAPTLKERLDRIPRLPDHYKIACYYTDRDERN